MNETRDDLSARIAELEIEASYANERQVQLKDALIDQGRRLVEVERELALMREALRRLARKSSAPGEDDVTGEEGDSHYEHDGRGR